MNILIWLIYISTIQYYTHIYTHTYTHTYIHYTLYMHIYIQHYTHMCTRIYALYIIYIYIYTECQPCKSQQGCECVLLHVCTLSHCSLWSPPILSPCLKVWWLASVSPKRCVALQTHSFRYSHSFITNFPK